MGKKIGKKFYEVTNCIHHQMMDFEDTHKKTHKLGRVECILLQLLISDDRPKSLKEIRQFINVSNSRITHLTDALITKGYIERISTPVDRRIYLIRITQKGYDLAQDFQNKQIKVYDEVLNQLSDSELDIVFENLNKWRVFLKETKAKLATKTKKGKQA